MYPTVHPKPCSMRWTGYQVEGQAGSPPQQDTCVGVLMTGVMRLSKPPGGRGETESQNHLLMSTPFNQWRKVGWIGSPIFQNWAEWGLKMQLEMDLDTAAFLEPLWVWMGNRHLLLLKGVSTTLLSPGTTPIYTYDLCFSPELLIHPISCPRGIST